MEMITLNEHLGQLAQLARHKRALCVYLRLRLLQLVEVFPLVRWSRRQCLLISSSFVVVIVVVVVGQHSIVFACLFVW